MDTNLSGIAQADYCGVIQTDATPTNIVVKILGDGAAFIAGIREIGVYELGTVPRPAHQTYAVSTDTDASHSFVDGAGDTVTDASIQVNVPDSGYVAKVTVDGFCIAATTGNSGHEMGIQEDGVDMGERAALGNGSGNSVVAGEFYGFSLTRVSVSPSTGSHTYRLVGEATDDDWTCVRMNLIVERTRLQ
jgi:hypothetical protein